MAKKRRDVIALDIAELAENLNIGLAKTAKQIKKNVDIIRKAFLRYEQPYSEISTNNKELKINIKLPNTLKKDILIKITGKSLDIEGIKRINKNAVGFYRSIDIPENAFVKKAKAVYKKDVLRIRIPLRKI